MYSLDVNFLRERRQTQQAPRETQPSQDTRTEQLAQSNLPLIIGAVVGVALPAVVGGVWYLTNVRIAQVQEEITVLEQELSRLQSQQEQVAQKQQELEQTRANLTALANIFNTVKPISAILEDVRDRAPDNVQISSFQESSGEEGLTYTLQGIGESYEAVNYFFLTLQRSPFVAPKSVNLQTANQGTTSVELAENSPPLPPETEFSPEPIINYTISFRLNDQSASELLPVLQEKGAFGLVTRINTLREKGIVQ